MRPVRTHPEKSIRFTPHAEMWCFIINTYRRFHPKKSFREIAKELGLSETSCRRYYYGVHHKNCNMWGVGYTQVRRGACCAI